MKLIKVNWLTVGALLLAGLCAAPSAHAGEESGGYFGAAVGQASASDYCSNTAGLVVTSCDDSDSSFKIFGGFQFTRNVAVEVAYVDLGKYHATGSVIGLPFAVNTDLTGITVQAVGIVPLGTGFSLMGRMGAIFWNLNNSASIGALSGANDDSGVDIAMGVGAQYKFTSTFGIRADVDYYPSLGNGNTGEEDVSAVSIGVVFLF